MNNNWNIVCEDIETLTSSNVDNNQFFNKNILITGGTGLIASYLIQYFVKLNSDFDAKIKLYVNVRNADRLNNKLGKSDHSFVIIEKNVEDLTANDFEDRLDIIYHLASSSSPATIIEKPSSIISANVMGTQSILELAKNFDSLVVFSSTREVYGKVENKLEIFEDDMGVLNSLELRSCYPESKKMAENLIVTYNYEHKIEYKIARISHVYGPMMSISNDGRIMADVIDAIVSKRNIELNSDGSALRSFCYITDAVEALLLITTSEEENVFNVANEYDEVSIKDLCLHAINLFPSAHSELKLKVDSKFSAAGYVKFDRIKLNTGRLESLGWYPKVKLDDGLKRTVLFYNKELQ